MSSKETILISIIIGCVSVAGFALSTNYYDRDDITTDYKSTTDGSYYRKHLFVNADGAEKALEEMNKEQENTGGGSTLEATPGKMQGLWSKADGTNVTAEEFEQHCQQVYGAYWDGFRNFIGVSMEPTISNPVSVQFDPYKGKFGDDIGLIHYSQTASGGAWGPFNQNVVNAGSATIGGSGCGPTALSASISTMLHKYITPLEIVAARDTMYLRLGQGQGYMNGMWSGGQRGSGAGAMCQNSDKVCEFVSNLKYNGQQLLECTRENLIQSRVDETLAEGGHVVLVPHGTTTTGQYWTGGGHYIAIRAKDDAGNYYTTDGSHDSTEPPGSSGNHDVPHPWSDLQNCGWERVVNPPNVHYITPGPGYEAYIKSLKSSGGSNNSGSSNATSNASADTQKILAMSDTEFWVYLTDGKWSSYDEVNAAWRSDKTNTEAYWNGCKETITVPAWKWADASKTSKVESTVSITVHKKMTGFFTDFMTDLFNLPEKYVMLSVGGFQVRGKNNGTGGGSMSGHSFGCTLDINAYSARGMGSLGAPDNHGDAINTPIASQSVLNEVEKSEACTLDSSWYKLAVKYQLNWGGNWSDRFKDPMHFSLVGDGSKGGFSTEKRGSKWQ